MKFTQLINEAKFKSNYNGIGNGIQTFIHLSNSSELTLNNLKITKLLEGKYNKPRGGFWCSPNTEWSRFVKNPDSYEYGIQKTRKENDKFLYKVKIDLSTILLMSSFIKQDFKDTIETEKHHGEWSEDHLIDWNKFIENGIDLGGNKQYKSKEQVTQKNGKIVNKFVTRFKWVPNVKYFNGIWFSKNMVYYIKHLDVESIVLFDKTPIKEIKLLGELKNIKEVKTI